MSNYTKIQNYTALRGSTPADPAVFDTEFTAIQTSVATKADLISPTFTGTVTIAALPADASIVSAAGGASLAPIPANKIYMHAFPTGTKMAFFQATAPLGWTQDVANNDAVLRVVSTAGAGTGGTGSIATGVVMPTITNSHVLTLAEIPAHTHQFNSSGPGSVFPVGYSPGGASTGQNTTSAGGGGGHTHTITAANWVPKYIDVIICTKD